MQYAYLRLPVPQRPQDPQGEADNSDSQYEERVREEKENLDDSHVVIIQL